VTTDLRRSVREITRMLIAFDSVSRNSNLQMIDWIRNYLDDHGIKSSILPDATGTKANLFATIGPPDQPGYVVSGHTDVVPVDGQQWSSDPFKCIERDGRFYGRGACDMKSFIAVALANVPGWAALPLKRPIHLAFSYDEEVGCQGAPGLMRHMAALETFPSLCIVGEPTDMQVVTAHKGSVRYRCRVQGHECHSAYADRGANAVNAAAEMVTRLSEIAKRKRAQGPFDPGFDPPYTTVHTGTIHGGTAVNIVPKDCQFDFEIRYIPGDAPEDVLDELRNYAGTHVMPEMKRVSEAAGYELILRSQTTALNTRDDADAVAFVAALAESATRRKISFGTEGGIFGAGGLTTVVCGPGSIDQAHKPDEWIALEQITACDKFMARLGRHAC
jgi:acetylornithine deacetylase